MKKNRILYIDLLKVIAIFFMVFIHTYSFCYAFNMFSDKFNVNLGTNVIGIIYIFTPIVFMFCMGNGLFISNKDYKSLIKRGLNLLIMGFVLNIIRGLIFYFILGIIFNPDYFIEGWYWLWGSDILFFAGLFFILFGFFKKFKFNDLTIFIIAFALFIIFNIIPEISISNYFLNMIIGNFIYLNYESYFPLFTWSIYPVIGYLYQKYYDKSNNKDLYVLKSGLISFLIFFVSMSFLIYFKMFDSKYLLWGAKEFDIDIISFILSFSLVMVYISLIYYLSKLIKNKKIIIFINYIGKGLNKIYFIHWIIVMYGLLILYLFGISINNLFIILLISIIILIISCCIFRFLSKKKGS